MIIHYQYIRLSLPYQGFFSNHRLVYNDFLKVSKGDIFKPQADLSVYILHQKYKVSSKVGLTFYKMSTHIYDHNCSSWQYSKTNPGRYIYIRLSNKQIIVLRI